MPRICIFATISAENSSVTVESQTKVKYFRNSYRSNVFGVFNETDASETRAHIRISRRTHNCIQIYTMEKLSIDVANL